MPDVACVTAQVVQPYDSPGAAEPQGGNQCCKARGPQLLVFYNVLFQAVQLTECISRIQLYQTLSCECSINSFYSIIAGSAPFLYIYRNNISRLVQEPPVQGLGGEGFVITPDILQP